jgi:hypothetical protein
MLCAKIWLSKVGFVLLLAAVLCGCSTVVPSPVVDREASWDGDRQTSGLLGFNEDGSGHITARARARYNALVALYGARFTPPLIEDEGVTPQGDDWRIDAEHLVKFATMARWRKEGK